MITMSLMPVPLRARSCGRWGYLTLASVLNIWIVFSVLLELCEEKAECHVLADSSTFQQDPCPDTYKYLEVHYKCKPDDFQQQTACEGHQMALQCSKAGRIAVLSAVFGRAPNGSDDCPANRPGYIDCQASEALSEVRAACQGRKSCELLASESVFGNPCASGINKYLSVTYACVHKKLLKEIHRHRGHSRKRKKKKKKKNKGAAREGEEEVSSPSGALAAPKATQVLDTQLRHTGHQRTSLGGASGQELNERGQDGLESATFPLIITHHPADSSFGEAATQRHPLHVVPASTDEGGREGVRGRGDPELGEKPVRGGFLSSTLSDLPRHRQPVTPVRDNNNEGPAVGASRDGAVLGRDLADLSLSTSTQAGSGWAGRNRSASPERPQQPGIDSGAKRVLDSSQTGGRHEIEAENRVRPSLEHPVFGSGTRDNNSASSPRSGSRAENPSLPGGGDSVGGDGATSTEEVDTGKSGVAGGMVTEVNLTALCANQTVLLGSTTTLRTLHSTSETPRGVVKEMFSTASFLLGHQEKAILYLTLGVCVGVILLLSLVLARLCYRLKRKAHAKLDMTEPTHSRNVSHLAHHTHMNHHHHHQQHGGSGLIPVLDTPPLMLEHSDSIDRIEVVRFEPRGTLGHSGYHSTLRSDSGGDRSLNNYYG